MAVDQRDLGPIEYQVEGTGPDHNRTFSATLVVAGKAYATAQAKTKKDAERLAAWQSLSDLEKA